MKKARVSDIIQLSPSRKEGESMKKGKETPAFREATFLEVFRYADKIDYALLAVSVIASCAVGTGAVLVSAIFRGISDTLMKSQSRYDNGNFDAGAFHTAMLPYICYYFAIGVFDFFVMLLSMGCMFTVCERQADKIRDRFFRAVLYQDAAWFDSHPPGEIAHKMSSGIERIKQGLSDKLAIVIQALSTCVIGIVVAFTFNWKMTLVTLFIFFFIVFAVGGSQYTIVSALRGEMRAYAAAGAVASEVLQGIRTVQAFNAQPFETQRYDNCLQNGKRMGIRKGIRMSFFFSLYWAIFYSFGGLMFWYGTHLAFDGVLTPGTMFAIYWMVFIGAMKIGEAMPQLSVIVAAKLAAGEIFAVIDRKPVVDCRSDGKGHRLTVDEVKGRIEFRNVHFSYPTQPNVSVLNGVSFKVEAGESVALVGHSGCGKSTIVSLLMRYYECGQDEIMVDGRPIQDLNVASLRQAIGIVAQEPVIFAITVEQNLRLGNPGATTDEIIEACIMANAHEFIQKLHNGYQTLIGEGGVKLSGGEKQRLAIARALIRRPKILLLDEATSALDTESEAVVQRALEKASAGRTTITIAHRLSTIRNADRILVFEQGSVIESGNHSKLLALGGIYMHLCAAQEIAPPTITSIELDEDVSDAEKAAGELRRGSRDSERLARSSARLRRSLLSINDFEQADAVDELKTEGARPASAMDILRFARPERWLIVAGVVLATILGIFMPTFSLLYGQTFKILSNVYSSNKNQTYSNKADNQVDYSMINHQSAMNALRFLSVGLMIGISSFGASSLLSIVGERLTMRLRSSVFQNLLRQDASYFDDPRHVAGKLAMRLATDAPNVQSAIDHRLAGAIQGVVSLICAITAAFFIGWNVAPIGLATVLGLLGLQATVSKFLQRRAARASDVADDASKIAAESIEYVRTVQSLTRQEHQHKSFQSASRLPHRLAVRRSWWQSIGYALHFSFIAFNFGIVYLIGTYMIEAGWTTPFVVFQVVEVLNLASFTIMRTATYFPEYARGKLSAGLMFAMANVRSKIDALSDQGLKKPILGSVEANGVYFAYPNANQKLVLQGLSLNAQHGKTIALVGPSGCGKSTIIQLLERFYDPIDGHLSVDGTDIRQINIKHLRSSIALVGQEPTLFDLSIRENIAYGLDPSKISDKEIVDAAKQANIHDFIDSLPEGTQLSGGQKQRIAIARAIVRNPKILLLDEATSALDTKNEKVVQEALDRARQGRTCIVVAHRLSTIQNANLIAVVREGQIGEMGTHQQLLARGGLYRQLIARQSE